MKGNYSYKERYLVSSQLSMSIAGINLIFEVIDDSINQVSYSTSVSYNSDMPGYQLLFYQDDNIAINRELSTATRRWLLCQYPA